MLFLHFFFLFEKWRQLLGFRISFSVRKASIQKGSTVIGKNLLPLTVDTALLTTTVHVTSSMTCLHTG